MTAEQPALPMFKSAPDGADSDWLVGLLAGRDWITARQILQLLGMEVSENHKRWLRKLADESQGRIAGHQQGYKLVRAMTGDEYQWWRNEWLKADASIRDRIREADIVFYARQPIAA